MSEMVLPGTYIEVRPEGLIIPGQVTVGNIGIVGTASKGAINEPILLGSYADALQNLGSYDAWPADATAQKTALTLVRALELAYNQGATTVFAVRVADTSVDAAGVPTPTAAVPAQVQLTTTSGVPVTLTAKSEGTWGNSLFYNVSPLGSADPTAVVENETHTEGGQTLLLHNPIAKDARTRIQIKGR
ncbi:MAG: phage tail sheath protein, partial [Ktedonobacteraceae bacterium]